MEVQLFTAGGAQERLNGRGGIEFGFEDLEMQKQGKRSCRGGKSRGRGIAGAAGNVGREPGAMSWMALLLG